jgi:hypothetical protein
MLLNDLNRLIKDELDLREMVDPVFKLSVNDLNSSSRIMITRVLTKKIDDLKVVNDA